MDGTIAFGAYTLTADAANKTALVALIITLIGLLGSIAGSLLFIIWWITG